MARFEHGGDTYGCPPDLLDCSIHLNPMGAPGPVLEGACRAGLDCARYPDPACRGLRRAIARRDGVEEDQILCGNGASDLIYRMALACKLRQALLLAPTFSEYRRALEGVGCQIREHRLEERTGFLPGEDLLEAIEAQAAKLELVQDILLEVNIAGEESKGGCTPQEAEELAALAEGMDHVRLRGLMAIPPVAAGPDGNRPFFAKMRQLYVDIRSQMDDNKTSFDCLSMGMSGDFEDAVREGATLVRVGTALFGPRPPMHKG